MKSYFPDVNVWLALAYRGHQHHPNASAWFHQVGPEQSDLTLVTLDKALGKLAGKECLLLG
jgi:hypothetical protein